MIRDTPKLLKTSAVESETHDKSSLSAVPGSSWPLPMNARRDEFPYTLIAETTAVITPNGARQKMKSSRIEIDSERNCLVICSPNNVIRGAYEER